MIRIVCSSMSSEVPWVCRLGCDDPALERVRVPRVVEIALLEFRADHARLHDGGVEQRPLEIEEPGLLLQRMVVGADDLAVPGVLAAAVFADGLARAGDGVLMDFSRAD